MLSIAQTPQPPYFAVIFTSIRTEGNNGYGEMADQVLRLACEQPRFLGFESARQEIGISVSLLVEPGSNSSMEGGHHASPSTV
jgi:hypothetical protein